MRSSRLSLLALVLLPGCATMLDGTTQPVTLRTAPEGAACSVSRNGTVLGSVPSTPGTLTVHRDRQDLSVTCQKPGWATAVTPIKSRFTGVTAGNIFGPFLVGVVIDEATHANYRYDQDKMIVMTPQSGAGPGGVVLVPAS